MSTKNILKTLALALLLVSACSKNEITNEENTDVKGYTLPVTVNVTRQGDDDTKATYNDGTKKLSFSAGDKLFVKGQDTSIGGAGFFAGTLTWQSGGSFSGTILTQNEYSGTIDALLTTGSALATLLPAGYETYGYLIIKEEGKDTYSASLTYDSEKTFADSKATAVEQFSFEVGGYTSGTGFALSPANAILNFTITGLAASTEVAVALSDVSLSISGNVTTNGSGTAKFAMSLVYNSDLNDFTLTVGGNAITLVSSSKVLTAGKIYNITRSNPNAPLPGIFSISDTQTVQFSKGNLQATYNGSAWTWGFAANQWDYIGNAAANTSINGNGTVSSNGTVDLFGWSTAATILGINNSPDDIYTGDFADWGSNATVQAGIGTGWRTLTSDEWTYLFDTRTASTVAGTANARFAKAYLFGTTHGIILFPDSYTHPDGVTAPTDINMTGETSWNANQYNATDWGKMEAAGCVFLPAAGYRNGTSVINVGSSGYYWSSTTNNPQNAFRLTFNISGVDPAAAGKRRNGYSVRLVQEVVTP